MQRPQHEADVPVVHTTASGKPVTAAEAVQGAATTPTAVLLPEAASTTTTPASSAPTTPAAATAGAAAQQPQHPEGVGGPTSGIKHALTGFAEKIGLKVRREREGEAARVGEKTTSETMTKDDEGKNRRRRISLSSLS